MTVMQHSSECLILELNVWELGGGIYSYEYVNVLCWRRAVRCVLETSYRL